METQIQTIEQDKFEQEMLDRFPNLAKLLSIPGVIEINYSSKIEVISA